MAELPRRSYGQPLGPGIYDPGDGTVHIVAPEICAHFGVPATKQNQDIVIDVVRELWAEQDPVTEGLEVVLHDG